MRLLQELHRRRVLRTAGYYIIAAWSLLQVADVLFPGFGIPDASIQVLVWAAFAGFPVALLFGWFFDIGPSGITRTAAVDADKQGESVRLARRDWFVLLAMAAVFAMIAVGAGREAVERARSQMQSVQNSEAQSVLETALLENSIAVLPFDNVTPDPDNRYFCDGVADEILNSLGRFDALNVIGRTSSFAFRQDRPSASRISAILGARYLLQGSVRIAGKQLRISTQLLDARGVQLWSATFDRLMEDVFKLQSEIAEKVAAVVVPQVTGLAVAEPPSPEAYDAYLRGRDLLSRRQSIDARAMFREAIAIDPDFAAPYSELAITLAMGATTETEISEAEEAITTAQSLAPGSARALAAQGLIFTSDERFDPPRAERLLRKALQAEPSMVDALNWLATSLSAQGKQEEAGAVLERALRIDPLHPVISINYANRLLAKGQLDAADRVMRRLLEGPEKHMWAYNFFMDLYANQGRLADSYLMSGRQLKEAPPNYHWNTALAEFRLGRWERGKYWLAVDERIGQQSNDPRIRMVLPSLKPIPSMLRGRYSDAYQELKADFAARDLSFEMLPNILLASLAVVPALAGQCEEALPLLRRLFPAEQMNRSARRANSDSDYARAAHALAWCQQQLGQQASDDALLAAMEQEFQEEKEKGQTVYSDTWFTAAVTASLRGQADLAVARFRRAVDSGWRFLNLHVHEPMWAELRQDSRVESLLEKVRADIATERQSALRMDAEWDPIEWYRGQAAGR